jgi:hypothetical protein
MDFTKPLTDRVVAIIRKFPEKRELVQKILTQFIRSLEILHLDEEVHRTGEELRECMDSVLKLTILLLESIDTGTEGIDEFLAADLRKTYEKYLGKFLV